MFTVSKAFLLVVRRVIAKSDRIVYAPPDSNLFFLRSKCLNAKIRLNDILIVKIEEKAFFFIILDINTRRIVQNYLKQKNKSPIIQNRQNRHGKQFRNIRELC